MMETDVVLAGDRYAPVTSQVGFIRASLFEVSDALYTWRTRLHGPLTRKEDLPGGLTDNIRRLEPLTVGYRPRELLVATSNPEWTAVFDCGYRGGDPIPKVSVLCEDLHSYGLAVAARRAAPLDGSAPWGARQFEMFGPLPLPILNEVRAVSVTQDGRKWRADFVGPVQPFEQVEAYSRRRVTDRFTGQMLQDYARELGVDAFDLGFYEGPSTLVTSNLSRPPQYPSEYTIEEAQQLLGITPDDC